MRISVLVETTVANDVMDRLRTRIPQYGTTLVSDISANSRKVAYSQFFNRTYSADDPTSLNIANRFGVRVYKDKNGRKTVRRGPAFTMMTKAGRVDRRGRRLVNFALDVRQPFTKIANFTAFPLNLYENDVRVHGKLRPGTHIMLAKLPPAIQGVIGQSIMDVDNRIQREFAQRGNS